MRELVEQIRDSVSRHTRRTPLLRSEWLSSLTGGEVHLKCENLQITGSFKVRGAYASLARKKPDAVVSSSAGNHGQGLALAAKSFGIPCTIVVPSSVARVKEEAIRSHGAEVVRSPFPGYDDTQAWLLENRDRFPGEFISPFEDDAVIADTLERSAGPADDLIRVVLQTAGEQVHRRLNETPGWFFALFFGADFFPLGDARTTGVHLDRVGVGGEFKQKLS